MIFFNHDGNTLYAKIFYPTYFYLILWNLTKDYVICEVSSSYAESFPDRDDYMGGRKILKIIRNRKNRIVVG